MAEVKEAPKPKAEAPNGKGRAQGEGQAPDVARRTPARPGIGHPMAVMQRLAEEMDRLFEDFGMRAPGFFARDRGPGRREAGPTPAEWAPRVDVRERDGQLLVRADLPGMGKDDIKVEIDDDTLTIQGERKQEKKEEREGYRYSECSYGRFFRAIPLPEGVDASKATAEFRDGVLEVAMPAPRRQEPKARRLEVREKK